MQKGGNFDYRKFKLALFRKIGKMLAMDPASKIIAKFGGEAKVAEITNTAFTAPYRWQHEKAKGGTGGLIPQRHHRTLLDYAEANNIPFRAEEFLPVREPERASA